MHLFVPYLLNDSKNDLFNDSFFQTPLLREAKLRWLVLFILVLRLIKQSLWAQCFFVYSVTGETAIFIAPKAALSVK